MPAPRILRSFGADPVWLGACIVHAPMMAPHVSDAPAKRQTIGQDDLVDIVDHIVGTHHVFTRAELARLVALARKVAADSREGVDVAALADLLVQLDADLVPHMQKEEQILFPYIVALETGAPRRAPFSSVKQPIALMQREHERTLILMRAIRTVSHDFRPPFGASDDLRDLYAGIEALDADLATHMSLESDVLFARTIAEEEKRGRTAVAR